MNTLTHWTVAGQLNAGFRYFDIRPVIHDGSFYTGNYSAIGPTWLGGNGQDIASIVPQVTSFLLTNPELVILDLSHMYTTHDDYRTLTAGEFNNLVYQLKAIPLNSFIANGSALIVLLSDTSVSLPLPLPVGFFPSSFYGFFNEYADTALPSKMASDQLLKMQQNRQSPDNGICSLSWTLTTIGDVHTIKANKKSSPNIIMIDGIGAASPSVIADRNVVVSALN